MRGITPVVELVSQAEWDACAECDGQQLEGAAGIEGAAGPGDAEDEPHAASARVARTTHAMPRVRRRISMSMKPLARSSSL